MSRGEIGPREIGKVYGLLAVAFALFVIVIAMLAQFGLPEAVATILVMMTTVIAYVVIGIVARTLSLADFYVAGRKIPAGLNGLATAAAFISTAGFIGLAGAFFANEAAGLAIAVGWTAGFAVLVIAVAPYYRKSGAVTLPDWLAVRFGNPAMRILGVIILLACSLPLLAAAIAMAGRITELTLDIDADAAIVFMCVVLLFSSLLGGMKAVTLVAGAQAIVILFGMVAPSLVFSIQEYGLPIPQLTYGDAVTATARLADMPLGAMASALLPVSTLDSFNLFAITLCIGAGVVALPHVLARSGTTVSVAQARVGAGWALAVVAVVAATAPAIAGFAKLAILTEVIGVEVADLPQWVFDYAASGLVTICGTAATTVSEISTACGATAVVNGLSPGDLSIATDAVALGFADITGLPYVLTVLIATAALAAALGTGGAVLIALATSLAHDVYGTLINRRAPHGRRLIVSRLALIAFVVIGAWLATSYSDDMIALAFAAPSLAAAGFFPAIVLGIWWRRTTFAGALSGMAAGFAVTAVYVWMLHIEAMDPLAIIGLTEAGISGAASAILGVPLGFVVIVVVSLMTPAPSEARLGVIDAIRRPNPDPILEDHAV